MSRPRTAQRIDRVPASGIRRFFDIAAQMSDVISLGIGEPDFVTPAPIRAAGIRSIEEGRTAYTSNSGLLELRVAISDHLAARYGVRYDPETEILITVGVSEGLQNAMLATIDPGDEVLIPEPAFVAYPACVIFADGVPVSVATHVQDSFQVSAQALAEAVTPRTRAILIGYPNNPTGAVMPLSEWEQLFALSDRHGFVIASDECYSEIYFRDEPPLGGLEAAVKLGRTDFRRLVAFTSLSKRSNVPGMRSGFVAGDAALIKPFLLYRTYHGSAMSGMVQAASVAAWNDEAHVVANRELYRTKFGQVTPLLASVMDVRLPDAGFYLWAGIDGDDIAWAQGLLAQYNVAVLPGSLLAREAQGHNPGRGRIRMALVAGVDECLEAARRIVSYQQSLR